MNRTIFRLLSAAVVSVAVTSCSDRSLSNAFEPVQTAPSITFRVDDFIPADCERMSRTTVTPGQTYSVTWAAGDVIGIFPAEGCQVPFRIADSQVGQASAQFDGGNWAIKDGIEYNAYYPFNKAMGLEDNACSAIPVTYHGQSQTGSDCCVGAFDYTYSDWKAASDGTVNFNFHHIGAIVELTLVIPATADYTGMTLSAGKSVIPMTGSYDLTAATPVFVPDNGSRTSQLNVKLNSFSATAGQDAKIYFMLPPMDPTATTLSVTLSTGYNSCSYSLTPVLIEAGRIIRLTGKPESSDIPGTIEEWGSITPGADDPVAGLTSYSASILCNCPVASLNGVTEVGLFYSDTEPDPKSGNATKVTTSLSNVDADGNYTIELTGLKENTTYYYRSYYKKSGLTYNGTVKTFKTLKGQYFVELLGGSATDITSYRATINASLSIGSGSMYQNLSYGFCWGTSPEPTARTAVYGKDQDGSYSYTLTQLDRNTTYYYRPYAMMDETLFYGPESSFTTSSDYVAQSGAATGITCFSAMVTSTLCSAHYQEYGLCYGPNPAPATRYRATSMDQSGQYVTTLTGLAGSTTCYYRPYVVIDGKTHYGEEQTFTTIADNVVTTGTVDETTKVVTCTMTLGDGAYSELALGVCWSSTNSIPTIADQTASSTEIDGDGNYTVTIIGGFGTIFYRAYLLIDGVAHYGEIRYFDKPYVCKVGDAVDLGLSVKWATFNVGATAPEEYGDYFAWGETVPKTIYDWSTYKYCNGSETTLTKYCGNSSYGYNGYTDSRTVLDLEDDAASVNWGGDWRMPTFDEQEELRNTDNCTWEWTTLNGINGYKVTSKKSGYAGNWIFLPAAGYRDNANLYNVGFDGYDWSSSLYTYYPYAAHYLDFYSGYYGTLDYCRYYGQSVRPVCP